MFELHQQSGRMSAMVARTWVSLSKAAPESHQPGRPDESHSWINIQTLGVGRARTADRQAAIKTAF